MGIVHAQRRRLAPAAILAVLMALAVIVTLGIAARPASAQSDFTTCGACHTLASTHSSGNASHTGIGCTTCHNNGGTSNPPLPSACATCHTPVADVLAKPTHSTIACGTTPGCHGYTSPTPTPTATSTATPTPTPTATAATTTMTFKASQRTVRVRRSVRLTGTAGPLPALAGAKVAIKVQRKVGRKWVKMRTATKAVNSSTGKFSWSYRAMKKGQYRVTASIAKKANVYTAKKLVRSFRVK